MPRSPNPHPLGLDLRYWPLWIVLLAGAVRLASLGDGGLSHSLQATPEPLHGMFARLTDLGLSDWILVPALVLTIASAIAAVVFRRRLLGAAALELTRLFGFILAGVGLSGLAVNLIKRLVGRGRPYYLDTLGPFDYRPFAWNWTYESFPSGHSTTIFALAAVVGFLVPRAYGFALLVAALVGLSRIVVGMHYLTDVIAGAVCGLSVAYLVRLWFASRGWLFRRGADGAIVPRGYPALRRLRQRLLARQRPAR